MKKKLALKLSLNKETLRNLSDRDLKDAAGGATALCSNYCQPTGRTECYECGTGGTTSALSGGSCPSGAACCY